MPTCMGTSQGAFSGHSGFPSQLYLHLPRRLPCAMVAGMLGDGHLANRSGTLSTFPPTQGPTGVPGGSACRVGLRPGPVCVCPLPAGLFSGGTVVPWCRDTRPVCSPAVPPGKRLLYCVCLCFLSCKLGIIIVLISWAVTRTGRGGSLATPTLPTTPRVFSASLALTRLFLVLEKGVDLLVS